MKEQENVQYVLKKSRKRRTVGIKVAYDSAITVYAPSWMRKSDIEHVVKKKTAWIRKKQREFFHDFYPPVNRQYQDGEQFYFLGYAYSLRYVPENRRSAAGAAVRDDEKWEILLPVSADIYRSTVYSGKTGTDTDIMIRSIRSRVADVYRKLGEVWISDHEQQVKDYFLRKVIGKPSAEAVQEKRSPGAIDAAAVRSKLEAVSISLRMMKSRWGSCRNDGSVILSLRLFGAPEYLIYYVVYHELCHLIHFNHSRDFYRVLSRLDPKWREHRKELHGWAGRLILKPLK